MDYCMSAFRKSQKEETIYYYIADGLYGLLNQNGTYYTSRLVDILNPVSEEEEKKQQEEEKEEAKEIVSNIKKKLRGNDQ